MGPIVVGEGDIELSQSLCSFIRECPSPFHTVVALRRRLEEAGFTFVPESEVWNIERGGRYYTTRNGSSLIAFKVGAELDRPYFKTVSSHTDSPTYKIKSVPELCGPGAYVRLNTEGYGGLIDRTWLDRPLSIAGRVMVQDGDAILTRLFAPNEDLVLIPSVAIHQDRNVNGGGALNRQIDMVPLFSAGAVEQGAFVSMLADHLDVEPTQILAHDLVLSNRQAPVVWGASKEFVSAPRLDDLQCAYAAYVAFIRAVYEKGVLVYASFDNEEVGSGTMQGALSTFLGDTLERICTSLGYDRDAYARAVKASFLASCDNAHAVHPNHPELYDEQNRVWLNRGVVLKESAAMRYTTSARSRALFEMLCRRAGVPTQAFANRSDSMGGSTLGNLLTRQVSMQSVDIGLPQLAMHSSFETAGTLDTGYMIAALAEFFSSDFEFCPDGTIRLG